MSYYFMLCIMIDIALVLIFSLFNDILHQKKKKIYVKVNVIIVVLP